MSANTSIAPRPTLRVLQWAPQKGVENTLVYVVLDAMVIRRIPAPSLAVNVFDPERPYLHPSERINMASPLRRFAVLFGGCFAKTVYSLANEIVGGGIGESMISQNIADPFVILSCRVPAADKTLRDGNGRILVHVQIVDENAHPIEEVAIGTWETPETGTEGNALQLNVTPPVTPDRIVLKLNGDLNRMALEWTGEEWARKRRLVQFFRHKRRNTVFISFRPITPEEYTEDSVVISCIFREEWNECFVTSVDMLFLLESLLGMRFAIEERNRIRRNLEGFKPVTVSKSKLDSAYFFKLIMSFENPRPRNIEKDLKVFPWRALVLALDKIINKYVE